MRRLMLLIAAASLWLFLAAVPALADGGPHVASVNSGVSSLTADSCAGCHRAHTAQGALLLKVPEEELCLSCHGDAVVGATTDVMSGIQYALGTNGLRDDTAVLGALRGGGFDQTRIGDPFMTTYASTRGVSKISKIEVADTGADVTSAHLAMTENGLTLPGIAWGNGANGSGAGPAAVIGCASCHNPHGNGAYRILNPIPAGDGINAAWKVDLFDTLVSYTYRSGGTSSSPIFSTVANVFRTVSSHNLLVGDVVTVAGNTTTNATNAVVAAVLESNTFTLTGVTVSADGTGGTVTRNGGVKVIDGPVVPADDTRNYTVIQLSTESGIPDDFASQVAGYSPTQGDYFHYRVPWNGTSSTGVGAYNYDAPNGQDSSTLGATSFDQQTNAWCASCHTRYWAANNPLTDPADGTVGAAYANPRPGDGIFTFQHRTRGESGRACLTCHVSHGTSAVMDGAFSATVPLPNGTPSNSSRLLKVDNRGTCVLCHDPTGTIQLGDQYPPGAALPSVP